MKIKFGKQIEIENISNVDIDLFLFADNVEERKLCAYGKINSSNKIKKTIGLFYPNSEFKEYPNIKSKIIKCHDQIIDILDEELSSCNDKLNIVIDYSCMTKSWYYTIILYLSNKKLNQKQIKAYFNYTPSVFSEPLEPKPNTDISPLPGKFIISNNKPKALIVGLGYEENKAQGIIDQLDPAMTYLFYTDPALDSNFVDAVQQNNKNILIEFKPHTIKYPSDNLIFLERELTKLYYNLKDNYNIIIAPLGPKPFTYVAMMMSIVFTDIEIWRVGSGEDINPYFRKPFEPNKFIVSEVVFENE
ncbi:hypothetical protein [Flavobacterium oreochromis]|uniref:SMODS-associated and fused to various effectors domain-containing protein n=1 Tax=Flavobacterium columnare TaxID=996 RepID=A0A2D0AHV4_9FLAO|nr:hypothetical protein [Flavobacterium oreochromis]OWP77679.1 hypothetical protein BWK62_06930 [Flavobacterium oreochromis]